MSKQTATELSNRATYVRQQLTSQISGAYPTPGSRGSLLLSAAFGSHWISWEKTEHGVSFVNPQDPSYDLNRLFSAYRHRPNMIDVDCVLRLDNLGVNTDNIKDVVIDGLSTPSILDRYKPIEKGSNFVLKSRY